MDLSSLIDSMLANIGVGKDTRARRNYLVDAAQSVMPEVRRPAQQELVNALAMGMGDGGIGGAIKAFHGSPHTFDKFSMNGIGTGEGAQAYGHGLYFAENPRVAQMYKEVLSDGLPARIDGGGASVTLPQWVAEKIKTDGIGAAIKEWESRMADETARAKSSRQPWIAEGNAHRMASELDAMRKIQASGKVNVEAPGNLYETNLRWPDPAREAADPLGPQHFLDWDKPLMKQPQAVQNALTPRIEDWERTGGEYVQFLNSQYKADPAKLSEALAAKGIPGIRYLDQGSRATSGGEILGVTKTPEGYVAKVKVANRGGVGFSAPTDMLTTSAPHPTQEAAMQWARDATGGGTANYVMFDPAFIEILRRNGMAP